MEASLFGVAITLAFSTPHGLALIRLSFLCFRPLSSSMSWTGRHSLITKPAKKALIQLMISVCGTIIIMLPFMAPMSPSMAAGSMAGFPPPPAAFPSPSGSFRNLPSLKAATR